MAVIINLKDRITFEQYEWLLANIGNREYIPTILCETVTTWNLYNKLENNVDKFYIMTSNEHSKKAAEFKLRFG